MGPYVKRRSSEAIDDGWSITDGDGVCIAMLDTENMADAVLDFLVGLVSPRDYPRDVPIGGEENENVLSDTS